MESHPTSFSRLKKFHMIKIIFESGKFSYQYFSWEDLEERQKVVAIPQIFEQVADVSTGLQLTRTLISDKNKINIFVYIL